MPKRTAWLVPLLALSAACSSSQAGDSVGVVDDSSALSVSTAAEAEAEFLTLLNQERGGRGLPPLARDAGLDSVARGWSAEMARADVLSHNPNLVADIAAIAPDWRAAGENVGVGGDVPALHRAFVASPHHLDNIVGDYNRVGVGVVLLPGSDKLYVTFDFVRAAEQSGATGIEAGKVTVVATGASFTSTPPTRVLDSRTGVGGWSGKLAAGEVRALTLGAAAGPATSRAAVVLNVTVTEPDASGYLTVFPCSAPPPNASNLNFRAQETVANLVTVASSGATVCFRASSATHVVADLAGYYGPTGLAYTPVTPARLLDTRGGTGGRSTPLAAGEVLPLDVAGHGGLPAGAQAASLNLTITEPSSAGYLTAFPCGESPPNASNVNFVAGQTVANLSVVRLSNNGQVCLYSPASTHVIVDAAGSFATGGGAYSAVVPLRLLDTRSGLAFAGRVAAGQSIALPVAGAHDVPPSATAASLNVTVTEPLGPGYLTLYPCGAPRPNASNVNYGAGQTVPNAATVKLGTGGAVCLYASQATHAIVDLAGYFTP